ncbi:MAG: DUF2017 family protein [Ornithinibacter sp.]
MAKGFRRRGSGRQARYAASLDGLERATVAGLMDQVRDLLAPQGTVRADETDEFGAIVAGLGMGVSIAAEDQEADPGPSVARDPALDRLLPTANREDAEAASEFRRLTETGLRRRKAEALGAAAAILREDDRVRLDPDEGRTMLVALTDVRLVLGERMGLRTEEDMEALEAAATEDDDGPLAYALAVYDFLTWLQETLSTAMLEG